MSKILLVVISIFSIFFGIGAEEFIADEQLADCLAAILFTFLLSNVAVVLER